MARRLTLLVVAVSLLLAPSLVVGSGGGHHHRGLVGTWLVTIEFPGIEPFRYLWSFTADGNSVAPLPLLGPGYDDTRAACVGPWKRSGRRTYALTLYCLSTQETDGRFHRGTFTVTLGKDRLSWSDPAFEWEWWLGAPPDGTYIGGGIGAATAEFMPLVRKK